MPKQVWKIDKFHGGLNSNSDPRDLVEGELAEAQDVMVDELGKIRTMGGVTLHESDDTSPSVDPFDVNPGYGLVQFSHDRADGHLGQHLRDLDDFNSFWSIAGDFEVEAAFGSGEFITSDAANNRTFDASYGNWIGVSATRDWGAALGRSGGGMSIDPEGVSTSPEGVSLATTYFTALEADKTYKVTVDIKGGEGGLTDFKFTLGGTTTSAFDVTTSWATYTKYIKAGSDSLLSIFNINNDDVWWYMDNVSITQVSGATYIHDINSGSGAATLLQTAANRLEVGIPGVTYAFTYTVSRLTEPITVFKIVGGSSQFASADVALTEANGTHTVTFTSHADAATAPFTIQVASTATGTLHLTDLSLRIADASETGDDYLAILANKEEFTDTTCDVNSGNSTIAHTDDNGKIKVNMLVSGTNIPSAAYVLSVTSDTAFVLSTNPTGSQDPATLTFRKIPGLQVYSKNRNTWGASPVISMGSDDVSSNLVDGNFYTVDGAVRIGDGKHIHNSMWYGYIKRILWKDIGTGFGINQWYGSPQALDPPAPSYYNGNWTFVSGETGTNFPISGFTIADRFQQYAVNEYVSIARDEIADVDVSGDFGGPIARIMFSFKVQSLWVWTNDWQFWGDVTIRAGTYNTVAETWGHFQEYYKPFQLQYTNNFSSTYWVGIDLDTYYTGVDGATSWVTGGNIDDDEFRIQVTGTLTADALTVNEITCYEGDEQLPSLHDGGLLANGYLTGNNMVMLFDWATESSEGTTGGIGWAYGDSGLWNVGVTYIYDGNQESTLTKLIDQVDGSTETMNLSDVTPATLDTSSRPAVLIAMPDPTHEGYGESDGTLFNKRITGCNIYMQDVFTSESGTISPWYLQYKADFETGELVVQSTQAEYDAKRHLHEAGQSYYYWLLPRAHTESPAKISTYEINSGYRIGEEKTVKSFKTAVVSNRMAYVGNVRLGNTNTSANDRVYGDRMMKSSVNQFDKFMSSRVIDASVEDGDSIVRLEEYADRILQFKKQKMHLINVSQDIEFLEETFMYKGVAHPASVCKTDYGVAWVNVNGCYIYDGKEVHNLLENKGRQIIKESEWSKFLTANKDGTSTGLTPMLGYIPKKRQLVVYDDITAGGNGSPSMYLYDMVTKTWVKGANDTSNRIIDTIKSNFINDWNGDLVYTVSTDGIYKLSDTSVVTDTISFKTNDIDFGQPSQRKKVYKIYMSYKGDATGLTCNYNTNGDTDAATGTFYLITSDGSSSGAVNGSNANLPLLNVGVDDWVKAELKPSVSINNIDSFQLAFDGTAAADFEINDISIVFRLKSIK